MSDNKGRTFYGDYCDMMDDWAQSEHPFLPIVIGGVLGLGVIFLIMWLAR